VARIDPRNRVRYWRDPKMAGLSLLHADFTRHDYAPHAHDALVVAVTEAGGSEFKSRGLTEEASQSRLLVFNPAEPHSGRMGRSTRWRYRALYLTQAALDDIAAALGTDALRYFTSNVFADRDLVSAFLALHRTLDAGDDTLRQRELLVASFGELFRRHARQPARIAMEPRDRAIHDRVVALMRERHAENLTLEEMGAAVALTPFQLIGLFKRATGLTPHAFLTQIRLRAAASHLRARQTIADASLAAGFYDQSALTNHFKRAFGITPLQYVKAMTA
jgi:AraC-like DNA-binding protein